MFYKSVLALSISTRRYIKPFVTPAVSLFSVLFMQPSVKAKDSILNPKYKTVPDSEAGG